MTTQDVWGDLHKHYRSQDWIDKPSLFAAQVVDSFPAKSNILELGTGLGQDCHFFAEYGFTVTATDLEQSILDIDRNKQSSDVRDRITFKQIDLRERFPFEDQSFDVVYAHLALHYFGQAATKQIFAEIERVLKPQGWLAFLVNSTSDPEYKTGTELEPDFFQIDNVSKRYFSVETVAGLTQNFEPEILDNLGETYKDSTKGVHHLIRFLGKKKFS
jgi:ubiquinone/menaquinone biosynthesis C-methylase UbiE